MKVLHLRKDINPTTKERIRHIYQLFIDGFIPSPTSHEVNPNLLVGSKENYIYFTLPCALNYQRNSPAMWASALATYLDTETQFLFKPEEVISRSFKEIQQAMRKNKLALKVNKDVDAWIKLSRTLHYFYNNDPKNILIENKYKINKIITTIQREKKDLFPYLRGPKLSNYWLFILSKFTDAEFSDPYKLSIIPDVHIIRASKKLNLVEDIDGAKEVEKIWRDILKELQILPSDMHSVLWNWSRSGFVE